MRRRPLCICSALISLEEMFLPAFSMGLGFHCFSRPPRHFCRHVSRRFSAALRDCGEGGLKRLFLRRPTFRWPCHCCSC